MNPNIESTRDLTARKNLSTGSSLDLLWDKTVEELRTVLPIQNPLHSFVHNNMLIAWEKMEFWQGAFKAARLYGAAFPKSLEFYQREWMKGRFQDRHVEASITNVVSSVSENSKKCIIALLKTGKDYAADPIFRKASRKVNSTGQEVVLTDFFTRGKLDHFSFPVAFGEWFCLLCESYLDQGVSHWPNPFQDASLRQFAIILLQSTSLKYNVWGKELLSALSSDLSSKEIALKEATALGLTEDNLSSFLTETAFSFKGWVGLVSKLEKEPEWFPFNHTTVQLEDALVILLCARRILELFPKAKEQKQPPSFFIEREEFKKICSELTGVFSFEIDANLIEALNLLNPLKSAQILHEAYEQSLYEQVFAVIASQKTNNEKQERTRFGILCCMDDREESFRRHLEDVSRDITTYGVLGNFNLDMKFSGWDFPNAKRQCPPVVVPRRTILEKPVTRGGKWELDYGKYRTARSRFNAMILRSTGAPWKGLLASLFFGPVTAVVLLSRVLLPQSWAIFRGEIEREVFKRTSGKISLKRETTTEQGEIGYSIEEQAAIVSSVLKPLGDLTLLPPLVIAVAHQATTNNNPFQQAYGCGACSGNSGAANARVFCLMANSSEVREKMRSCFGVELLSDIRFFPAVHDTTLDRVEYLTEPDEPHLPLTRFAELKNHIEEALGRNAKERCALFGNAPKSPTKKQSLRHVQFRALNLAEPRPEYGHNRVGVAIFARRELTKNICLDRRAFLVSYDPGVDDEKGSVLQGLIHGALPVAANIGLDYFFSSIDPHGFGAGSKLPLNVSALIGVVSGSRGDIRIGLANQAVEIHEPARVLAIVETETHILEPIVFGHARLKRILSNNWMRLVVYSPSLKRFLQWDKEGWKDVEPDKVQSIAAESWQRNSELDPSQPWSKGSSLKRIWLRS